MLRRGGAQDARFLRDMLVHAYYWRARVPGSLVSRYARGWGRPGDTAVIALEGGFPVGAAWFRLFPPAEPGYGFVDESTPELAIAVVPSKRGHGIGDEMLKALLAKAKESGYNRAQPQRRARQSRPEAVRAPRVRGRGRGRRSVDDGRLARVESDDRMRSCDNDGM